MKQGLFFLTAMSAAFLLPAAAGAQAPARNWATMVTETDGGHLIGDPQAPVKLTEFVSYTCPTCARFASDGEPQLKLTYVAPGRISVEVRQLVRDPVDMTVGMLVACGPPEKFQRNHTAFMLGQADWIPLLGTATDAQRQRWTSGPFAARLRAIASDFGFYNIMERLGYSRVEADRCLNDEDAARQLAERSAADWQRTGISGTPAFAIDGVVLAGTYGWRQLAPQLAARF